MSASGQVRIGRSKPAAAVEQKVIHAARATASSPSAQRQSFVVMRRATIAAVDTLSLLRGPGPSAARGQRVGVGVSRPRWRITACAVLFGLGGAARMSPETKDTFELTVGMLFGDGFVRWVALVVVVVVMMVDGCRRMKLEEAGECWIEVRSGVITCGRVSAIPCHPISEREARDMRASLTAGLVCKTEVAVKRFPSFEFRF